MTWFLSSLNFPLEINKVNQLWKLSTYPKEYEKQSYNFIVLNQYNGREYFTK